MKNTDLKELANNVSKSKSINIVINPNKKNKYVTYHREKCQN